jgi:hypothetical protein
MSILQEKKSANAKDGVNVDFAGEKIYPVFYRTFTFTTRVLIKASLSAIKKPPRKRRLFIWRRERDSNPRYPEVHTLSRRALSATQTPLRKGLINTRRLI